MLNADMDLAFAIDLSPDVNGNIVGEIGEVCQSLGFQSVICSGSTAKTTVINSGSYNFTVTSNSTTELPFTEIDVEDYASDNNFFLSEFALSFVNMVTVGYAVDGVTNPNFAPLGTLTPFDYSWDCIVLYPTEFPTEIPTAGANSVATPISTGEVD